MRLSRNPWLAPLGLWVLLLVLGSSPQEAIAQDDDEESDEEGDDDDDDDDDDNNDNDVAAAGDDGESFPGDDRFFISRPLAEGEPKRTRTSGSLTSSSLLYREFGVLLSDPEGGDVGPQGTAQRVFTDLRAQLWARDISGGSFSFRGDVRGRFVPGVCKVNDRELDSGNPCRRLQSGSFSGNELDLREFYIVREGTKLDLEIGRQFVLELAAHRLDGAMVRFRRSEKSSIIAFAGLHPQKGSRDLRQDYPKSAPQADGNSKRLLPVTGGVGLAYRLEKVYGSVGAVGVLPLADAQGNPGEPLAAEDPRVFLSGNGYYRASPKLDIFHYMVLDVLGSAALGLTNLTVGVNARPAPRLRANLMVSRIDTETLATLAETKLENPDGDDTIIQNNFEVLRIGQDTARLGLSGSFKRRRYELSTTVAYRRRPEVVLRASANEGALTLELPAANDVEATVAFVDRKSFAGLRLGAQIARSFGIGENQFQRSSTLSGRITAQKPIAGSKGELDAYLSVVKSDSAAAFTPNNGAAPGCDAIQSGNDPNLFESCFAGTSATSINLGATAFYRIGANLMAIGSASIGTLRLNSNVAVAEMPAGDNVGNQGNIMPVTLFLRLAYRL